MNVQVTSGTSGGPKTYTLVQSASGQQILTPSSGDSSNQTKMVVVQAGGVSYYLLTKSWKVK